MCKSCKCDKNQVQNFVYHKQRAVICVKSENWASSTSNIKLIVVKLKSSSLTGTET